MDGMRFEGTRVFVELESLKTLKTGKVKVSSWFRCVWFSGKVEISEVIQNVPWWKAMSSSTKVFEQIERSSGSARQICSSNAFNVRERKFVMRDFNQEINTDGWSLEDQRVISRCSSKGWEGVGEHSSSSMLDVEPMDNWVLCSFWKSSEESTRRKLSRLPLGAICWWNQQKPEQNGRGNGSSPMRNNPHQRERYALVLTCAKLRKCIW